MHAHVHTLLPDGGRLFRRASCHRVRQACIKSWGASCGHPLQSTEEMHVQDPCKSSSFPFDFSRLGRLPNRRLEPISPPEIELIIKKAYQPVGTK